MDYVWGAGVDEFSDSCLCFSFFSLEGWESVEIYNYLRLKLNHLGFFLRRELNL